MNKVIGALFLLIGAVSTAHATEEAKMFVDKVLQQIAPRLTVQSVADSPMPDVSEVVLSNGDILYVNPKAESFMIGQMVRFSEEAGLVNVTDAKKQEISDAQSAERKQILAEISEQEKVTYSPEGEVKARIHVFTDISCPYCVKLHREIPELNKMGIEVSYLAFPRAGQGSTAHKQMNAIWCAGDEDARRDAMDQAKLTRSLAGSDCKTPVIEQMALGQSMGVTGTPALVMADGKLVPGYVPAKQLAKMLGIN